MRTLIKGQIFKLLAFDIIVGGHSKNTFNEEGGGGSEKAANGNEQGKGVQAYLLYIRSVKKIT